MAAYLWGNDLIKSIVCVLCTDPHFNPGLDHVILHVTEDSVIAS